MRRSRHSFGVAVHQAINNKRLMSLVKKRRFAAMYVFAALVILLLTTLFWTLQSAHLQTHNADQLVNPYLFGSKAVFEGANFPGAHTFLLKWPLFWLIKIFGYTSAAYVAFTVLAVLLTIGCLVYIMYRLERRPLVFGTLCLALASTLLLVPAQPYAGGLLPVNMAMLATRNLEYVLFLVSLRVFVHAPRIKRAGFWIATLCMVLLIASDKLFLALGIGGALLALIVYALDRQWKLVSLAAGWLLVTLLAGVGAIVVLGGLSGHLTHIAGGSGVSPYAGSHGLHGILLGLLYAGLGLLTNFGANPAFDATVVRNIPNQLDHRLLTLAGPAFIVNILLLLAGLYMMLRMLGGTLSHYKKEPTRLDEAARFTTLLVWTTVAAFGVFIVSNHYYAVDARYLGIALFTVYIGAAAWLSRRQWQPTHLVLTGVLITISMLFGLSSAGHTVKAEQAALDDTAVRNTTVSEILIQHKAEFLVGDYWRVLPIKHVASQPINIMPLSNCTTARTTLSSNAWQPDLTKHSFAYLLSFDRGLTDYPSCNLAQVVAAYGRPNASVLVAGTLNHPKEQLLFYDRGAHKSSPKLDSSQEQPATVVPVALQDLPYSICNSPTILTVVAHQDDDLLFTNPDLVHEIKAGHCIRTIYVTAGDAGNGSFYWLSRQQGSEAAYSEMLGSNEVWVQRIVKLSDHQFVTVANPRGNAKISLIFMNLPDGNLKGQGFGASHNESLARLESETQHLDTVDSQSTYSSAELTDALTSFMHFFQPSEIHTQSNFVGSQYPDHSDHMAVGRYTTAAYKQYEQQQFENRVTIPIHYYIGYPIHEFPINLSGDDLDAKEAAFMAYANYDGGVCHSLAQCKFDPAYGAYLPRQYENPY